MKKSKGTYPVFRAGMLLFVLVSSVCCSEEPTHCDGGISSRAVRFAVTETDAWGALPYMKGDSVGGSDRKGLTIGKFVLRDERQEECLFLDAVLLRGITKEGDAKHAGVETRSAPVTDLATYGAFGISGYVYDAVWDGTQNPDFMYDVEVSRSNGDVWVPDRNYFLPNTGQSVRFYAWAPYRDAALSISERDEAGAPVFSWQVQPEVIEQQDLLVASSGELATDDRSTIQLRFRHVLTAVKFTAGEMLAGKITRIALKGVYGSGSYTVDALGWNDYDTLMDFEQRLDVAVDGSSDIEITSGAATFMMIPQTLPEGATVEVEFTDDLTGMRRTLTADIGGTTWPVGQTVCYRISTQSISVVPRLEVTPPADFTYEGGKAAYSVRSCLEVSRAGDETRLLPAAWTPEFSTDDGMTWTTEKPDWLTAFVSAGDGGSTAVEYSAEVVSQTGVTSDPHGDALRAAIPVSGIYNLSNATGAAPVENTANCYLVHAPGTYSLPLVYGNAIRDGEVYPESYTSTITDAQVLSAFVNHLGEAITSPYIYKNENCVPKAAALLWQDEKDLVDAQSVKLTDDDSDGVFDHLQFTIPSGDTFKQGNAVLALFDKDDESNIEGTNALWSWHIWVTDYRLGEDLGTVVSSGTAYSFMPLNLGWCAGEQTSYAGRSVKVRFRQTMEGGASETIVVVQQAELILRGNGPYYQNGRKDPMYPSSGTANDTKTWYDANGVAYTRQYKNSWNADPTHISKTILFPRQFSYNWSMENSYTNLWNTENDGVWCKSIYDPCPAGYRIASNVAFEPFFATADEGRWKKESKGYEFQCTDANGTPSTLFFPAAGFRHCSEVVTAEVGSLGYYWSATLKDVTAGRSFSFSAKSVASPLTSGNWRSGGFSIRPVKE